MNTVALKGYGESILCAYIGDGIQVLEFRSLALIRSEIKMNMALSS